MSAVEAHLFFLKMSACVLLTNVYFFVRNCTCKTELILVYLRKWGKADILLWK